MIFNNMYSRSRASNLAADLGIGVDRDGVLGVLGALFVRPHHMTVATNGDKIPPILDLVVFGKKRGQKPTSKAKRSLGCTRTAPWT